MRVYPPTVSSLRMQSTLSEAEFFASAGFDDILYAVPVSADKLGSIADLMRRVPTFHVMVDHPVQVNAIEAFEAHNPETPSQWSVFIMVDCGCRHPPLPAPAIPFLFYFL